MGKSDIQPIFVEFYNLHLECGFEFYQRIEREKLTENRAKFWVLRNGTFSLSRDHQSYPRWTFYKLSYTHQFIVKKITLASEVDRKKIIHFFSQYQPAVTAFLTAKSIQEQYGGFCTTPIGINLRTKVKFE